MRRALIFMVVAAGTLLPAAPAGAHAQLTSSIPKEGAKLNEAPTTIRLNFSEPPISADDLVVEDGCGNDVVASAEADQTDKEIVAKLGESQPGDWKVSSRVVSTVDGHPTKDSFTFTVAGEPDCTEDNGSAAPRKSDDDSSGLPLLLGIGAVTALVVAGALFVRKRS